MSFFGSSSLLEVGRMRSAQLPTGLVFAPNPEVRMQTRHGVADIPLVCARLCYGCQLVDLSPETVEGSAVYPAKRVVRDMVLVGVADGRYF